jgi:radical SAM/Cys-rich protein
MNPPSFTDTLIRRAGGPLRRARVTTLQVNVGRRCDLACHHCHVEAGPKRTETMNRKTADRVLALLEANPGVGTFDVTGGAPELNAEFRHLVRGARSLDRDVIDRCNLTVFDEPGQEDTPEFLANNEVKVIASLPC